MFSSYGINDDGTLWIELQLDGITYRCSGFKTLKSAKSNLEAWEKVFPTKLEHLLRAVGVEIFWKDDVYKWCGKYNGKLLKTFLSDYDLALKELRKQWRNANESK